ncbi:ankyrin repeat domain-containing protein 17 [Parachaetomium inaequale]|uniref:Ankyrin repeat domain-containing protein 17 n=1 Tax=Parachaetomium inaequale TaxID=2588326 RepID=A0AAN6SR65_9PEZI|nr:ankyrin repeat domain-containing protein 17 [Parachaetomium inaequale]
MDLLQRLKRKAPLDPPEETSRNPTLPIPPSCTDRDYSPSQSAPVLPFPDGVKVLHDCPDAAVDICFVHGLTGDRESTWTADGQSAPWPKTILPTELDKARILTYGYDAYIVRKGVVGANRLIDHATNLLHDLTADRSSNNASSRPLILIAHSLGGLVCKKAILLSRNNPEAHLCGVFECIKGIIFMGTPHKGSWMAGWAKIPAWAVGAAKSTNRSLLEILETDDQLLQSTQVEFWSMVRGLREGGRPFEVTCFFEELPLPGLGKVVSKESASLEGYAAFSIHANHSDMVKFASAEETGFKRLVGELVRWASQLEVRHPRASQTEELPRTSPSSAEGHRGASFVNNYGSSTQNINSITTGSGPANIGQNQAIHQTIVQSPPVPVPELSQDCLRSLAFPQMQDRSLGISRAVAGTCEWLLRHETYKTWAACYRGLLWIKGKPGSGKSTLLKHALGNHASSDGALVLSFFFHGRGDELQKSPLGLFRSLLHQVLGQAPNALQDLVDRFKTKCREHGKAGEDWHWHEEELRLLFESSLPKLLSARSVWLFVDALDECGKDNAVRLVGIFKSLLKSLPSQSTGLGQFRICFSCRHYPILDLDDNVFEICVEHENQDDISTFVDDQLAAFRARTPSTIPALITERASGVFMWARLVVERVLDLEREGGGLKKMETAVHSTPRDLDELYRQLIQDMGPASLKLIQWICFARRPLPMDELRWAMVIDADCPHRSLQACESAEDYVPDSVRMKRQVQTLSRGLAEVTHAQVAQFIHQSVKDFFVEKGLPVLNGCETSAEAAIRAHFRLAKICIRYLAMEEIGRSTSDELRNFKFESNFPFLGYATTSTGQITEHVDVKDGDCMTPLSWAAEYGHEAVVKLLLDTGKVDVNAKDDYGATVLMHAATNGEKAVVKLLLDTGKVDVNAKDHHRGTALRGAAANGEEAIVKLLLDTGKGDDTVDTKDDDGRTPLSLAAEFGYEGIVKLLLDTGKVDDTVDTKDDEGWTPLSLAAYLGNEGIVKLLLDTGKVDVDRKDAQGVTPLSLAAAKGHEGIVKLLLGTGRVDVHAKDNYGITALLYATANEQEAIVKLLGSQHR